MLFHIIDKESPLRGGPKFIHGDAEKYPDRLFGLCRGRIIPRLRFHIGPNKQQKNKPCSSGDCGNIRIFQCVFQS